MQIDREGTGPWQIILFGDEPVNTDLYFAEIWVADLYANIIRDELLYNFHDENGRSIMEVLAEEAFDTYCNTDRTPTR